MFVRYGIVVTMSHSVKKNFVYNSAYQIFQIITPLVTTPYLSRVLEASGVGLYSYTYAIAVYFVMFATLGMSNYGVRAMAAVADNPAQRNKTFSSVFASQLVVAIPVFVFYLVYAILFPQGGMVISLLWAMYVFSSVINVSWLFFGMEDFAKATIINIATKVLELVGIFTLIHSAQDVYIYCGIDSLCFLLGFALLLPFLRKYVKFSKPTWAEVKVHFLPNLKLFIPVIAISLYTTLNSILLGAMSTMEQTGYFDYSNKMARMPLAVITALGTVMLPRMSNMFAAGKTEEGLDLLDTSMWLMLAGGLAMAFGITGIAPEFVVVFFGPGYEPCAAVMTALAWIVPLICATNVIGAQYLLPLYRDNHYTISVCAGAVINVVLCLLLISELGALGAALGVVAAEFVVLTVQVFFVRGELPLARYVKNTFPFFFIGIVMAVFIRFIVSLLMPALGMSVLLLVIEILVGVLVFCLLSFIYCLITKNQYFWRIVGKNKG